MIHQVLQFTYKIFRSYDPADPGAPVLCDERDFFDFLTPNDTHVYDLDEPNFPKNEGENSAEHGEQTTLDLDDPSDFERVCNYNSSGIGSRCFSNFISTFSRNSKR